MIVKSLQPLADKWARCKSLLDVSGVTMDGIKGVFGCHVGAALFFDDVLRPTERAIFGVRDSDVDEYERHWRPTDRVFSAVLERAVPVHNWQVWRQADWANDRIYTEYGRRHEMFHYLSAPIFGSRGRLSGVVNFCRRPKDQPFTAHALQVASAFSGFLSATLSRVREAPFPERNGFREELTARELQVARLAASGRNNLEIALGLGIARETVKQTLRRVYHKFDVTGRAQMTATLVLRGYHRV
jgi:DNA-binding CsgD family transcriptional regulator